MPKDANRFSTHALISGSDCLVLLKHDGLGVDSHTLGGVVSFVDANETIGDLKHVVPQRDDDELSVLRLFLHTEKQTRGLLTSCLQVISSSL